MYPCGRGAPLGTRMITAMVSLLKQEWQLLHYLSPLTKLNLEPNLANVS
jgi:hypothetical protein